MSEQEKRRQNIYDLLIVETKPTDLVYPIQSKEFFLLNKSFLREDRWGLNNQRKEGLLTAFATAIKKDPTTSLRKHANELEVDEKTVRTAIKQDLSQDLNLLD